MDQYEDEPQAAYEGAPEFAYSGASVPGQIDEEGHINAGALWGVQTKIFSVSTPEGATLEQLASSHKNGFYWQMPAELRTLLKQVNKSNDRSVVSDKDLEGDVSKALLLEAKVILYYNDSPKKLDVNIDGLVPRYYGSNGRSNLTIPANCHTPVVVNQCIMDPENIFTKYMYEHNQKCNLKTLAEHIRLDYDPHKQIATMNTKGVGWKVLTDNLRREDTPFADAIDSIYAKNKHIFDEPDSPHAQIAQVPYEIAQIIYDSIATPLKQIEKSYVDFATWKIKFSPSNKQAWNSIAGLAKEGIAYGSDAVEADVAGKLCTPFTAGFDLEVKYVLDN